MQLTLLDCLPAAALSVDRDMIIRYANLQAARFLVATGDQLVGHPVTEFVPIEHHADVTRRVKEYFGGQLEGVHRYHATLIRLDGELIEVDTVAHVADINGEPHLFGQFVPRMDPVQAQLVVDQVHALVDELSAQRRELMDVREEVSSLRSLEEWAHNVAKASAAMWSTLAASYDT